MSDTSSQNQQSQSAANNEDSGSQAGALEQDLAAANKQIQELTETAKRALADLQNYRKRVEEERAGFAMFANVGLILQILPVLDNFTRAFASVPEEIAKTEWFKGTLQIEQQLAAVIRKQGVLEMPSQIGQKLDTRIHEPVSTGPGEKDKVAEEFEKGYLIGEKVIRPAKVKVGDGTALTTGLPEQLQKANPTDAL